MRAGGSAPQAVESFLTSAAGAAQVIFIIGDRIILMAGGTEAVELDVAKAIITANP